MWRIETTSQWPFWSAHRVALIPQYLFWKFQFTAMLSISTKCDWAVWPIWRGYSVLSRHRSLFWLRASYSYLLFCACKPHQPHSNKWSFSLEKNGINNIFSRHIYPCFDYELLLICYSALVSLARNSQTNFSTLFLSPIDNFQGKNKNCELLHLLCFFVLASPTSKKTLESNIPSSIEPIRFQRLYFKMLLRNVCVASLNNM